MFSMIRAETRMVARPQTTESSVLMALFAKHTLLRVLWRPFCWGAATVLALLALLLVSLNQAADERPQAAMAREPEQPQAVASLPPRQVVDAEQLRALTETLRTLTADRDRLRERVATLENNFDDMTGSIKTVMQANAAIQSVKEPPKEKLVALTPLPAVTPPAVTTPAIVPAASAPPPTAASVLAPSPQPTPKIAIPAIAPPVPAPISAEPVQTNAVPLPPLPPVRVAAAEAMPELPPKPEYGIDLGSALSLDAARAEWVQVKANFGPLLAGLRPLASPRQHQTSISYRLVVGPFATIAAAAKACAKFTSAKSACHTAKFTGEDIAER
jgi:hypothetical protein